MTINVNTFSTLVAMSVCTSKEDIQVATHKDANPQKLEKPHIIHDWP